MNVVIIDDDQLVALSLQTILEACDDIQVSATGGSGADAIRLYEEYQPDVLLMDIRMENTAGQVMTIRGESLGGGKCRIARINGVEVDFTGEYSTVIVVQQDKPGVVAHITKVLSDKGVNIAFMRLFRESKGNTAYTIVESDGHFPEGIEEPLKNNPNVHDVMIIEP